MKGLMARMLTVCLSHPCIANCLHLEHIVFGRQCIKHKIQTVEHIADFHCSQRLGYIGESDNITEEDRHVVVCFAVGPRDEKNTSSIVSWHTGRQKCSPSIVRLTVPPSVRPSACQQRPLGRPCRTCLRSPLASVRACFVWSQQVAQFPFQSIHQRSCPDPSRLDGREGRYSSTFSLSRTFLSDT